MNDLMLINVIDCVTLKFFLPVVYHYAAKTLMLSPLFTPETSHKTLYTPGTLAKPIRM